jgi:hypothetical protein
MPTPGGPLTEDRIKELGVIKMNDYLSNGTRPQFWEEYFVKVIMHAVKSKEIDAKCAAELLGVSYGTLYRKYRELFGLLGYEKHTSYENPHYQNVGEMSNIESFAIINKNVTKEQYHVGDFVYVASKDMPGAEPKIFLIEKIYRTD